MSNSQQFPSAPPQLQYGGQAKKSNGMAVAGFVLALLGALTSFIPIVNIGGAFLAVLGLIFGIVGLVKSRDSGAGKGLSIAAVILAVAALVISVVVSVVVFKVAGDTFNKVSKGQSVAAPVTGKIGQAVKDGKLTFVVNSVQCGAATPGGKGLTKAGRDFCAVDVSVSNHSTDPAIFDSRIQVEGFVGTTRYTPDMTANSDAATETIKPGGSSKAVVLIDVPAGQKLDKVEVHDSILSEGTSVSVK